jgi:hypothetical protein
VPPSFDRNSEFHPGPDNPIDLIEIAVDYYADHFDSAKVQNAWDYLKDTMGLETSGIWERWTSIPLVLSQNVGHPTISKLFDEAVRCYAFGQFAAAMAMCRALLEEVLDRLYGIPGDGLQAKIADAQHQFGELQTFRLSQLKKLADDVLHNHSLWRQRGQEASARVQEFLERLKAVIENAETRMKG